jgi:hypothetical protein
MQVQLIEGHATVTTPLGSQALLPGQMVYIAMGGQTGLEPITAPSRPVPALPDLRLVPLITLLDKLDGTQRQFMPISITRPADSGKAADNPDSANNDSPSNASSGDSTTSNNESNSSGVSDPMPTVIAPTPLPGQLTAIPPTAVPGNPTKTPKPTYVPKTPKPTYVPKSPKPTYTPTP